MRSTEFRSGKGQPKTTGHRIMGTGPKHELGTTIVVRGPQKGLVKVACLTGSAKYVGKKRHHSVWGSSISPHKVNQWTESFIASINGTLDDSVDRILLGKSQTSRQRAEQLLKSFGEDGQRNG